MNEKQLLELKKEVDSAKTAASELNGQKTAVMNQLKNDWDCKTVEAVETKLAGMLKDIANLDAKIKDSVSKLIEEYELEID